MQKTKASNSNISRKTRPIRAYADAHKNGRLANENTKHIKSFTGFDGPGLHILAKELKPITYFDLEANGIFRSNNHPEKRFKIYDTEEKQIQLIKDLYAIVKAQPEYKNLKEPSLSVHTQPIEVIKWLLKKLSPLADLSKGNNWKIDTWIDEEGTTRYQFVITKDYNSQKVLSECYIRIDFLPYLQTKDEKLHNLIVDLIAYVAKNNNVKLWYELNEFNEAKEKFCNENPALDYWTNDELCMLIESNRRKEFLSYNYQYGYAAKYQKLIEERKKVVTEQSITRMQAMYEPNSIRKSIMIHWITGGVVNVKLGGNIDNNTFVPNYIMHEKTVVPHKNYVIMWNNKREDLITEAFYNILINNGKEHGEFTPVKYSITKPGRIVLLPKADGHPERLVEWMKLFGSTTNQYCDYYFGTAASRSKYKNATMIEWFTLISNKTKNAKQPIK